MTFSDMELQRQQTEAEILLRNSSEKGAKPPGVMSILCLVALKRRLWLLPILTALWLFSSFWISYGIAVSYNHTEAAFPYISHTAIEAPERCVFGQMVNIGAVMLAMNVILRYLYVKKRFLRAKLVPTSRWYHFNLAGLCLGIGSAFGLSMVANFQTEVQRVPHYIGAFLAFGGGTIFCWFHAFISRKLVMLGTKSSNRNARLMVHIQVLNSLVMTLLLIIFACTKVTYKVQKYAGMGTKWGALRGVYLTSTITEWLLALAFLTYMLTYAPDFKQMRVDDPNIYIESDCPPCLNPDTNGNSSSHVVAAVNDVERGREEPVANGRHTSDT